MKLLIVNLARLGDIYLSWPAINAFRRVHPECQIDVLTRRRFSSALDGNTSVNNRIVLPTEDVMACLVENQLDLPESKARLQRFVRSIKDQKYDRICNFSYSPLSSFLTHAFANPETIVSGYTRTQDGFLAIPDDISAYFYAQVGIGRPNKYHLAEIFATQLGVDLSPEDWSGPSVKVDFPNGIESGIVVHVGASEEKKQISADKLSSIISQITRLCSLPVILIGSQAEVEKSQKIMSSTSSKNLRDLTGKTTLLETFQLISKAKLLLGADSAPQHMASLARTPCLNISFPSVNFWETGPRSLGSVVYLVQDNESIDSQKCANWAVNLVEGKRPNDVLVATDGTPSYLENSQGPTDFQWNLIKAIYLGEDFPENSSRLFQEGIKNLAEINQLALDQLAQVQKGVELKNLSEVLNRVEDIIHSISVLVPDLSPLIRWYQTEKLRIGPGPQEQVLDQSLRIHQSLQKVSELYVQYGQESLPTKKENS